MMAVIERPVMEPEAIFLRHLFIELRPGQGSQDKELGRRQPGFLGKLDGLLDRRPIVLIEYQDEHAVDVSPVTKQKKLPNQQPSHEGIPPIIGGSRLVFFLFAVRPLRGPISISFSSVVYRIP
ncbi:MAG: hypothetical protein ACLFVG_10010 [Candidatus Aminicenantes bacterium]